MVGDSTSAERMSQKLHEEAIADDPRAALLMLVGRTAHQSGVPTDVLEELITDVGACLELETQVNALPTSMTVAVGPPQNQRIYLARLPPGSLNLRRLSLINDLVSRLHAREIDIPGALAAFGSLESTSTGLPVMALVAAYCAESFGFAVLLGAGWFEAGVSAFIGVVIGALAGISSRNRVVDRLFEVLAALCTTVIVTLILREHPQFGTYIPLVAGVVQLLPGFMLTTALLELADRNPVSGTARLGAALLVLLSLTCGAAMGVVLVGPAAFTTMSQPPHPLPKEFLALGVLAVAFAQTIILHCRLRDSPFVLVSCALSVVISAVLAAVAGPQVVAFGTALTLGLVTNAGSRYFHLPQAVLLIPGILVLVPGSLGYRGFLDIFREQPADGLTLAVNAGISAVLIVAGLLFASLVLPPRVERSGTA